MKRFLNKYGSTVIIIGALTFLGCKKNAETEQTNVSIKGSDTMVNLAQKWAQVYMENNPDVSVQVSGGGSGTGIAALLNKTTDIATASREMKPDEIERAKKLGVEPKQYKVALDGIAVIVNPKNKVEVLTMDQLSNTFTGKITNWKEVGGADTPITLYGRENSSGTYEFFQEHVLGEDKSGRQRDFASSTQVLQGTASIGRAIAEDISGIGYGGVGYFALREDVKIIQLKQSKDSEAFAPAENGVVNYKLIWDKTYPISRYLYVYTDGKPKPAAKDFIEFILSEEGQNIVKQMEYIPLPKNKTE